MTITLPDDRPRGHPLHLQRGKPKPVPASGGAGTELAKLLSAIGITYAHDCKCAARARQMDRNGVKWCAENIETIVNWLAGEAGNRNLPFSTLAATAIVKLAIRRARRKLK